MNRCIVFLILYLFSVHAWAQNWMLESNAVSAGIGYEGNKFDDIYEGGKLQFEGQYVFNKEAVDESEDKDCCWKSSNRERLHWIVDSTLRGGGDGTGLEYFNLGVTPWAMTTDPKSGSGRKLSTTRDQIEVGNLQYTVDDALDLESYVELSLIRAGRMGEYRWSDESAFVVKWGGLASLGYAWAESGDPAYSKVTNPFAGIFFTLGLEHAKAGRIYMNNRFVNGFAISNPSRGHPSAREARVSFGYAKKSSDGCLGVDVFGEKRSFYFTQGDLSGRYTENWFVAIQLTCQGF